MVAANSKEEKKEIYFHILFLFIYIYIYKKYINIRYKVITDIIDIKS